VRAVIPSFGRRADVEALLGDLAALELEQGRLALSVLLVDNASTPPLEDVARPPELDVEHLRLDVNRGGSGGFSAGLGRVLSRGIADDATELIWLLDSDVRVEPGALAPLARALEDDPGLAAVGSVLCDPQSGEPFEAGGRIDPRLGEYVQELPPGWSRQAVLDVEYSAACSLLVRRSAAERAGPLAEVFLNGDDVEWCYRLARVAGGRIAIATGSRVRHPSPDRMRTWTRYFAARNFPLAVREASRATPQRPGFPPHRPLMARALREAGRALSMAAIGRDDLARLHMRGLEDAARLTRGELVSLPAAADLPSEPMRPIGEIQAALRQAVSETPRGRVLVRPEVLADPSPVLKALNAACIRPVLQPAKQQGRAGPGAAALRTLRRIIAGPGYTVAIVSARGRPADWLIARTMITVDAGGFTVQRMRRLERASAMAAVARRGFRAARAIADGPGPLPVPTGEARDIRPLTLSIIILSYNRWPALEATVAAIHQDPSLARAEVIIADNGSTDGSVERTRQRFPRAQLLPLPENRGIAAFNQAVRASSGQAVLILDDDAIPQPGVIQDALRLLAARADLGAVTLHPRHPATQQSEWSFAARAAGPQERWPVMGCANLVRREAWDRVGGYEESFFLYRNDTDLALKLLAAGYGVYFDPSWAVWHDSPAAAAKSRRWFRLGTRNWVWLCRRHGRGWVRPAGILAGWLWAHRLAGRAPGAHGSVLAGVCAGLFSRPARLERRSDGKAFRSLLRLRFRRAS
jgi:GT2 family glycosyltransferase